MIYLELFIGFLQVGLFSFGGAYAAIPLVRDIVLSYGWMSDETLSYMIAVSESTPGPIMINMATYVGADQAGLLGAFLATFAVVLPAFIIILLIMAAFKALLKNRWFKAALSGLQPCIIGIVLAIGLFMVATNALNLKAGFQPNVIAIALTIVLAAIMFGPRLAGKKVSPLLLIGISAVLGIVVYAF